MSTSTIILSCLALDVWVFFLAWYLAGMMTMFVIFYVKAREEKVR